MIAGSSKGADSAKGLTPPRLYRMLAHDFGFQSDIPGLLDLVDGFLVPFRVDGTTQGGGIGRDGGDDGRTLFVVTPAADERRSDAAGDGQPWVDMSRDGTNVHRAVPLVVAVDDVLNSSSIAGIASAGDYLALHAGAVSWHGVGAALPGPSGSGKSTLTAGLTYAGCGYLSDEAALIDLGSGDVTPFPKPLALSRTSIALVPGLADRLPPELDYATHFERYVAPDHIRPGSAGAVCPLRCVILPTYDKGSAPTVLEPMKRSQAVLEMIFNAFNFAECGPHKLQALGAIVRNVRTYRLVFSDLDSAVEAVMGVLDEVAAPAEPAPA